LGAEILEFHVVFDRNSFGPDATSSIELREVKSLIKAVRNIEMSLKKPVDKTDNSNFTELKKIFEKSLSINKDLPSGHQISFEDLESKKPKGYGIQASKFEEVIGKRLNRSIGKWEFLNWDDIAED
jgi:N,N'-diacetyllegionaminate synthase